MEITKYEETFFDIEVYPSWWCIVYNNKGSKDYNVISSDDTNFVRKVRDMVYRRILIGFNIKGYDLRVLNAIMDGCDPYRVYDVSQAIIKNKYDHYNNFNFWNKFMFSDLFDDWRFGSLKEYESNKGMSIVETTIPFDREYLSKEDKEEIIEYCKYDVYAVTKLFEDRKNYYETKILLAKEYNIDVVRALKSTNAKLAADALEAEKTPRIDETTYVIPEKIKDYVEDNVPEEIIRLFDEINEKEKKVELFENKITYGVGGIHSTIDSDIYAETDDEFLLVIIDAASFYPLIMIIFGYLSRNVNLPELYAELSWARIKMDKSNPLREVYKLIMNIVYGAMKNKYNNLYDPSQASSLCYTGQLLLTALSNKLYNLIMGLKVIQTNTDGILVKVHRNSFDRLKEITQEWELVTGIPMDFEYVDKIFQRDVNNYIISYGNGKFDTKGKWANQAKGNGLANLNAPITHKAIVDYYLYGTPIRETIYNGDDIFDFCFTTKTGHTYDKTYHYINDEPHNVNKINRVVATTKKEYGTIRKYKKSNDRYDKIAEIPDNCYLMNGELHMIDHLDRDWYVEFTENKLRNLKKV